MNTEFKFYKQQEAYRANGSLMPVCENFPTHIFSSRKFHRDRLHGCLSQAYARVQYTRSTRRYTQKVQGTKHTTKGRSLDTLTKGSVSSSNWGLDDSQLTLCEQRIDCKVNVWPRKGY